VPLVAQANSQPSSIKFFTSLRFDQKHQLSDG